MMEKSQYKILVLSDLTKSTTSTLRSSASLAKMIDGNVEFFCVKKPTDIVEKENQLSAIRTINKKYNITANPHQATVVRCQAKKNSSKVPIPPGVTTTA